MLGQEFGHRIDPLLGGLEAVLCPAVPWTCFGLASETISALGFASTAACGGTSGNPASVRSRRRKRSAIAARSRGRHGGKPLVQLPEFDHLGPARPRHRGLFPADASRAPKTGSEIRDRLRELSWRHR